MHRSASFVVILAVLAATSAANATLLRAQAPLLSDTAAAPPLPALGDATERARLLFDAIVRGQPSAAADFFLPRAAFRQIKAAANPDAIYDALLRAYERDIRALHASLKDLGGTSFVRVELSHRRGWVTAGEEANRLPYWAQRHNWLIYRVGQQERRLELRVLIAWEGRWFVTHLSEFKRPAAASTVAH